MFPFVNMSLFRIQHFYFSNMKSHKDFFFNKRKLVYALSRYLNNFRIPFCCNTVIIHLEICCYGKKIKHTAYMIDTHILNLKSNVKSLIF